MSIQLIIISLLAVPRQYHHKELHLQDDLWRHWDPLVAAALILDCHPRELRLDKNSGRDLTFKNVQL